MSPVETTLSEAGASHNASMSEIRHTMTRILESPQWRREELSEAWPESQLNQPYVEEPDRGEDFNARR